MPQGPAPGPQRPRAQGPARGQAPRYMYVHICMYMYMLRPKRSHVHPLGALLDFPLWLCDRTAKLAAPNGMSGRPYASLRCSFWISHFSCVTTQLNWQLQVECLKGHMHTLGAHFGVPTLAV